MFGPPFRKPAGMYQLPEQVLLDFARVLHKQLDLMDPLFHYPRQYGIDDRHRHNIYQIFEIMKKQAKSFAGREIHPGKVISKPNSNF
jgi:hypothetical protein